MKKFFLFCALALFLILPGPVLAEQIDDYRVDLVIRADGTVDVGESISYNFGSLSRHGIFRTIPFLKTNQDGKKFKLDLRNFSVTDENNDAYPFTQAKEGNNLKLKIGDPQRTVSGVHQYNIRYRVAGAITYFSNHDELYWNVTGNDWPVVIASAQTKITFPVSVDPAQLRLSCYSGVLGSTVSDCTTATVGGAVIISASAGLAAGEGLTAVVGFPKQIVSVLEPVPYVSFWETWLGKLVSRVLGLILAISALLWYLGLPIWIIRHWYKYGRDPKPAMGVTSAWFDVPKTRALRPLTPGETGTLVDEQVDLRDVAGTIVDLARRGYIKIIEQKKHDFYLKKMKEYDSDNELRPHERVILDGIFAKLPLLRLKDAQLAESVNDTKKKLYEAVMAEGFFVKNPQTTRTIYYVFSGLGLFTFNLPLAIIAFIFGRAMPVKTMLGAQTAAVARSLRNFIASQTRQLEFQAKNQLFFEKFLPYAVAFGVEKIWAQRFADIAMQPPDWYEGSDRGVFNSVVFANALSSSFSSFTTAATPTRSSSGFSSGFGGGGSSGGGGGGGGGGSW